MNPNPPNTSFAKIVAFCSRKPVIFAAFLIVAAIRLYYCCQLTINTSDSIRHICWGLLVNKYDHTAITQTLIDFRPQFNFLPFSDRPYNYPILALIFDQIVAYIYPSLFFMKLVLTLIEFINALLIYRITKKHFLSFVYWASPISIWWVSHEGQFEPLQSLFVLLALMFFADTASRDLAWMLLGLAIQVKLTAVFLVPYFILKEDAPKLLLRRGVIFLIAFLPSFYLLTFANPYKLLLGSFGLSFNPYYFNLFSDVLGFELLSTWLIVIYQITSWVLLIVLIVYGFTNKEQLVTVIPAILFMIFLKTLSNILFWYVIVLYPFLIPVNNTRLRNILWVSLFLLDIISIYQIVFGGVPKLVEATYYQQIDYNPFMNLTRLLL